MRDYTISHCKLIREWDRVMGKSHFVVEKKLCHGNLNMQMLYTLNSSRPHQSNRKGLRQKRNPWYYQHLYC